MALRLLHIKQAPQIDVEIIPLDTARTGDSTSIMARR